jgi:ketosteroid isomerase-like protein
MSTITPERYLDAVGQAMGGDWSAFADLWADDCTWHAAGRNPVAGDHHGKEAVVGWFKAQIEKGAMAQPLEFLQDDDHFVFFIRITADGPYGTLDQVHADAWRLQDGKFVEGFFLPDDLAAWDAWATRANS